MADKLHSLRVDDVSLLAWRRPDRTKRRMGSRSAFRTLRRAQHASDIRSSPAKGMFYAIPFAIVLWTLFAWAARALI